ncbi:regulator of chromosome condensation 1/beta-lactamase-inhibitor protein II [Aspergillus karnatakaensis]|uniref:RCC1 domain-containing protein n=1 Tax=Aspergillus karnatakaensis TaxID=1810916 RepID=UPI003CCE497C
MPARSEPSTRTRRAQTNGATTDKNKKRKAPVSEPAERETKRQQKEAPKSINTAPTQRLDVYVFGTNCDGELGLGDATQKTEIPRPVLNPKLPADTVGVVALAVGGVHSAALTHDNKILTWGVNDEGTLGRDTKLDPKEIKTREEGDSDSDDEDKANLNLKEATPLPIPSSSFPRNTVFTQLAATGSATFALTTTGSVFGWGTFRGNSGELGFWPDSKKQQRTPALIPGLSNVKKIVAGGQHVLALTAKGIVLSWGCDEQHRLGRRRVHHDASHPLTPGECALPSGIVDIGTGEYHSFAIHKSGTVYAWGSNNYGQTGIFSNAGQNNAMVVYPTKVQSLKGKSKIVSVHGGKDHSLAINEEGQCISWGRIENKALGLEPKEIDSANVITDEYDRPRILKVPTVVSGIDKPVESIGIGTDHSFAITTEGHAYSWGFNVQQQAGQPGGVDEVVLPTLLSNKHVDGKRLVFAAGGGQFSIVAGVHE